MKDRLRKAGEFMKHQFQWTIAFLFIVSGGLIWYSASTSAVHAQGPEKTFASPNQERTAEQKYRNIQVFKGLPESQLLAAMQFMAGSLGVTCQHCHTNQFAQDDKLAKQTARRMIAMMRAINQENFSDKLVVNCYTCHRGQRKPAVVLPVNHPATAETRSTKSVETMPTVDQVLDRYLSALGGHAKLDKLRTKWMKGSVVDSTGTNPITPQPLEIYRKAPNRMLMVRHAGNNTFMQAFDGKVAWRQFNDRVAEMTGVDAAFAGRDARFNKEINLREQFIKMSLIGRDKVGDREVYLIEGVPSDGHIGSLSYGTERLFFDIQTGQLLRRLIEIETVLGHVPIVTEFDDYREVDGVKVPFTIGIATPGSTTTLKFTEIKLNDPIGDDRFDKPGPKR
jgi:Photosynthetic reaction centre cytochrome C subunit